MSKSRYYRSTRFQKPKQTALERERSYRYMKQMWVSLHPAATPAEYDAAIAKITKELGL